MTQLSPDISTSLPTAAAETHALTIERVRRWGGPMAVAALDPATQLFSAAGIDGMISYRAAAGYAVVLGDPICSPSAEAELVTSFHLYCDKHKWKTIYIAVSEPFAKRHFGHSCRIALQCGEECYLDPSLDLQKETGTHASLVRRKVRHAQKEGVSVHEYVDHDPALELSLKQVESIWLAARTGGQIYSSHIRLFEDRPGKRWFYAQKGAHIVGIVTLNRMESKQGWHLNHLMFVPDAPHGTPEILIVKCLEALAREHCRLLTVGLVVGEQLGQIHGLGPCASWTLRHIFTLIVKAFHLGNRKVFWEKFPLLSTPAYVICRQAGIGPKGILAIIKAVNAL